MPLTGTSNQAQVLTVNSRITRMFYNYYIENETKLLLYFDLHPEHDFSMNQPIIIHAVHIRD